MPSKMMTAVVFALGVIAVTVIGWALFDHSVAKATALLLGMLLGGSMYFLMKVRE
jgi:multidrug transporter EmrE-like cation transporter